MKNQLLNLYRTVEKKHIEPKKQKNKLSISFLESPKVEITGSLKDNYFIEFINQKNNSLVYSSEISNNMWSSTAYQYFIDWKINVKSNSSKEVFTQSINLQNQSVKIINESPSLGDCIAWTPIVSEFQKKYNCKVDYFTPFIELFTNQYDNISIFPYNQKDRSGYYAKYDLGYYLDNKFKVPFDPRTRNLQQLACDILGLDFNEVRPKIYIADNKRLLNDKYVCISTSSTSGCKHWQNPDGWQSVVNYLNNLGFKVVVIQKESLNYMDLKGLNNVIHPTTKSLQEAISWLSHCEFYIGLGSGISWLAWGLNKKVIMISGFSKPFAEFSNPYRVINSSVCHGCWNDLNHKFDASNWNWCPQGKNFICSKEISFSLVKQYIDNCIRSLKYI